eukprot:m.67323 g.67323  ORF g.67323 m.67323 type:complete len:850 (-) comp7449_c0_seq1:401-2950(-)
MSRTASAAGGAGDARDFPFPGTPYDIQQDFMAALYEAIERGGLGVFESPTGTGKSLSLICGALKWLKDKEQAEDAGFAEAPTAGTAPDAAPVSAECAWVTEFAAKQEEEQRTHERTAAREKLEKRLKRIQAARVAMDDPRSKRFRPATAPTASAAGSEARAGAADADQSDSELLPPDCTSDDEAGNKKDSDSEKEEAEEDEEIAVTKILYCSRTHSQLSQFVREIQASPYRDVRVVALGSRQTLCVNDTVRALGSLSAMNDKCLDLQEKKKKGCPFMSKSGVSAFSDRVLARVQDIEQLVVEGRRAAACPYYGSRRALAAAEVVVMPYNILLHESTREAVGVPLDGNVVIIDEAHNLLDTICSIHSHDVTLSVLRLALSQLTAYFEKYKGRLRPRNQRYIQQILFVLNKLNLRLQGKASEDGLATVNTFLFECSIDNINLFKLKKYFDQSEISKKVLGFACKHIPTVVGASSHVSALSIVEAFLTTLTNADADGRIVIQQLSGDIDEPRIKYVLLNPANHFVDILSRARAVIVAGGTMAPVSDLLQSLLISTRPPVSLFSCGHIVPPEHILPFALPLGPSGRAFNFSYQQRDDEMVLELGRAIANLLAVIPDGVVVFFPSYDFEQRVHALWQGAGILAKMQAKKHVLREPRRGGSTDNILREYSRCVDDHTDGRTGALLLCVVGGKLSEGINFKDRLGRGVIMVGLPYPNMKSPELKEKMRYLDTRTPGSTEPFQCYERGGLTRIAATTQDAGKAHYENLCMKAVNQSIGRAIRHRGDYAVIVLVDERYTTPRVQTRLPAWIRQSVKEFPTFGPALAATARFFRERVASQAAIAAIAAPTPAAPAPAPV